MSPERWAEVERVYHAALGRDVGERAGFVRDACAGDEELRREVEGLLAQPASGDFLAAPAIAGAAELVSAPGAFVLTGRRIGVYQIQTLLGTGGMGEVYRARDTELGRDVAIKILPRFFRSDSERLTRFEREARVLASLNHPHIGGIYGFEEVDGIRALVLELVDGQTLADWIARGRLPLQKTIDIAQQIADALDAAHEKGIVHRDLKPANIKITPQGVVKVLDFGLAKLEAGSANIADVATEAPTMATNDTREGLIVGTAAYMSPEQARGQAVDKRTDIWAFGCVVFEMLTGKPAFDGDGVTDVLARVLEREPDWSALPTATPTAIRTLLTRCLEKDSPKRIAHISTALFVLEGHAGLATGRSPLTAPARPRLTFASALMLLIGVAAAGTAVWMMPRPASMPVTRFVMPVTGGVTGRGLTITPDGTRIIHRGANQLMVRHFDRLESTVLGSFVAPNDVFLSPDGQWVGFVDGTGTSPIKKVAISGGPTITLTTTDSASQGATWAEDGTIVYATTLLATGLQRVSSEGGVSTVLTRPDRNRGEADHLWPQFLPGGQFLLFTITATTGGLENAQIAVLDLRTGNYTTVLRGGHDARYVLTGHLVYGAAGTMRAVPFDLERRAVTGPPVSIVDGVATSTGGGGINMAVSATGTLVYMPGAGIGDQRSLVWVDRMGREEPLSTPVRRYQYARISPDGTRLALDIRDQEYDIWIWDFTRPALTRLTFDSTRDMYPVWTPDSRRIVFASQRSGTQNLYAQAADGTGGVERLTDTASTQYPYFVTPSGDTLVVREDAPRTGSDLLLVPFAGQSQPLLHSMFSELNAELSPDGRWLAYQSNESGRNEIYVRPFPDVTGGRWQVSTGGGRTPLWGRTAGELFYRSGEGAVMAVRGESGPAWRGSLPTQVLPARYWDDSGTTSRTFEVAPDGQRFLMIKDTNDNREFVVVQNWYEELKRLVPTK
jgi:Protein kinase domain/WD40-like Beta Propeller Repeat